MGKILEAAISRAVSLGAGAKDAERITGMLVGVCGPVELADDVVSTVGMVEPKRRDQVGGIEIHEEYVFFFVDLTIAMLTVGFVWVGCLDGSRLLISVFSLGSLGVY